MQMGPNMSIETHLVENNTACRRGLIQRFCKCLARPEIHDGPTSQQWKNRHVPGLDIIIWPDISRFNETFFWRKGPPNTVATVHRVLLNQPNPPDLDTICTTCSRVREPGLAMRTSKIDRSWVDYLDELRIIYVCLYLLYHKYIVKIVYTSLRKNPQPHIRKKT